MGVQKERKSTFLTAFEQREKKLTACLLHNIDIAVVSECLYHLRAQYSIKSQIFVLVNRFYVLTTQFQDWSGCAFCTFSLKRHTNSFVAVENNPMRFCIRLAHI